MANPNQPSIPPDLIAPETTGEIDSQTASHWLVDCYGCQGDRLTNADTLEQLLITAAAEGNLSVLRSQSHQFHPHGATVLLLLSESHLSIHTWPEKGYAALDLFTCGDRSNPSAACQTVLNFLHPSYHRVQKIDRSMSPLSLPTPKISTINKPA
ncbi:MAG: adenosylmethionine decarboxylase [Cyanobacteria bacterium P01_D01_bin.73]